MRSKETKMSEIIKYYRVPGLSSGAYQASLLKLRDVLSEVCSLKTESCFNVELKDGSQLLDEDQEKMLWILASPFDENNLSMKSFLEKSSLGDSKTRFVCFEIGPRLNFSTAWSTNAVSICHSVGLYEVQRIEMSMRYLVELNGSETTLMPSETDLIKSLSGILHDKMTQCVYQQPLKSFAVEIKRDEWFEVDVLSKGRLALEEVNRDLGLAFDDWDLDYYTKLFTEKLKRNPTTVECFDLAQSNSEHSRHWFFRGKMVVDGEEINESLMDLVKETQNFSNNNSIIKLSDNSSAIHGFNVPVLLPKTTCEASEVVVEDSTRHIIFTAETHNFPTGVAPFPGATTGTGGRIRDGQATGTGSNVVAGTAGYCFGNLNIPGYNLPWEGKDVEYPQNFALPLEIAVEASNGASDYGNKFGEPVIAGFARSFGMILKNNERREWIKPIMFSGGIGSIDGRHVSKYPAEKGMKVVKIGGPVYRIGVGGGSASSIQVQGDNASELDFGAVQRGDAEMEQKLNRAIRACVEMKEKNPICSIHDQGAGGNGNVLKELVEPAGAIIHAKEFKLGDRTISTLELWGAEYQESNALLVRPENKNSLEKICEREKVDVCFVGTVTGNGKIVLKESDSCEEQPANGVGNSEAKRRKKTNPVNLELDVVLGKMPRKEFKMWRVNPVLSPLQLDPLLTVRQALERVLRLPCVASKRYLTNKVDRSVTGLIAQQQCVGPLHTPVADVAVTSLSYLGTQGSATAIGEQPIKMLVDPCAGARMCLAEALTNLIFARITTLKDVKCSANWMWPAKLPGEGAALYDACRSLCETMASLGVAIDGGKDSLSMAARVGEDTVKAPGSLVVSVYAPCPDITATVTPDLKYPDGKGTIIYVRLSDKHYRLGGSALAQVFNQIGDVSPDLDQPEMLSKCFAVTQELLSKRVISSGHDVSDGGLITTVLEMAFAGNCGLTLDINSTSTMKSHLNESHNESLDLLFAEEVGIVLEVENKNADMVCKSYVDACLCCQKIGHTGGSGEQRVITVSVNGIPVVDDNMTTLRDIWEATSFQLEKLQANPKCVIEEESNLCRRKAPPYSLSFTPCKVSSRTSETDEAIPKVAVIREEGSNGDREMIASLMMVGFEVWDVNMQDICTGKMALDRFRGIVFVGGFSFADVLGSAKGWAAVSRFNQDCQKQFSIFLARKDTFSLGVCNGCQLMALLGWVGQDMVVSQEENATQQGVCFTHNTSERFESRFVTVSIQRSPSIMLRDMEGSTMGIWVSHGEGRAKFKTESILNNILKNNLAPLHYVDDEGLVTMQYPMNPNGSPNAIAALCSQDGRHLAMMPHPERCTLLWQWPWMPEEWKTSFECSPWLRMFQNAYDWCYET